MTTIQKNIKVGKYNFIITDNTVLFRDEIYCRNFKIGSLNITCVNVSIFYKNNLPEVASIPHIMYEPNCSIDYPLERGYKGSTIMIKTLLEYIHENIPSIQEIHFEDKSNIECATEEEIGKGSKNRKIGTNVVPIPLYYFSIAFNGQTWYEKYFNAIQKDTHKHRLYKERIHNMLYTKEFKSKLSFIDFSIMSQINNPEIMNEIENYYNNSDTLGDFFTSIPKKDRCRLVRDWITIFMSHHLKDVFSNTDWIIKIPCSHTEGGGKRKSRKKYYLPNSKITFNKTYKEKDFGIDAENV